MFLAGQRGLWRRLGPILIPAVVSLGSCRCPSRDVRDLTEATVSWCFEEDGDCLTTQQIERRLAEGPLDIRDNRITAQGTTEPRKLLIRTAEGETHHAKWKPVTPSLDESNNSPRRELAAYQIQRYFLSPERYVVPPTVLRCLAADGPGKGLPGEPFGDYDCKLGVLSHWVQDVEELEEEDIKEAQGPLMDHLSGLNVFTMLVGHRDSAGLNFLVENDGLRVFSVDNGMTFGAWDLNPLRLFTSAWSEMRIPALRRDDVEALRAMDPRDLDELLVVAQLDERNGSLEVVSPSAPIDEALGVRHAGTVIQLGLTREEVDGIAQRRRDLLRKIDAGEIASR